MLVFTRGEQLNIPTLPISFQHRPAAILTPFVCLRHLIRSPSSGKLLRLQPAASSWAICRPSWTERDARMSKTRRELLVPSSPPEPTRRNDMVTAQ